MIQKKKLKAKEKQLEQEQKQREEELEVMEGEYKNLQEAVDQKSKIIQKLKSKYRSALSEIKDLDAEHQSNKEELLDSVRILERDLDFYKQIVAMMLKEDQLYKIKAKSQFDDENNQWKIPVFILKKGEIELPKLPEARAKQLLAENLEQILEFKEEKHPKTERKEQERQRDLGRVPFHQNES